ncbi:MAG: cob(I)yrinic acid a,c-diamide adenosyltransferase [Coriobacteriia bacterium]|nr:cob(I)yrinic acid a,c-diamide adenosyltransferase [Coriobacteriia bacterium]
MAISKITTKRGDQGQTDLFKVGRVSKNHPHMNALGTLDELSSWLGLVLAINEQFGNELETRALHALQEGLALVLNEVALSPSNNVTDESRVKPEHLALVEQLTEEAKTRMAVGSREFILPGGKVEVAALHVARTIVRRAERELVAIADDLEEDSLVIPLINRLSDCCFALALAQQESDSDAADE